MKKSPQQLQHDVALYLDQQGADLTIMKVMMQVLVWNLIRRDPKGREALGHLKNEVLASLYQTMTPPPNMEQDAKEVERLRQLTLIRANRMFCDIEKVMTDSNQDTETMDSKIMGAKTRAAKKPSRVSGAN